MKVEFKGVFIAGHVFLMQLHVYRFSFLMQAFTEAARNISKRMPESGHKSVILCNERLNKYCTLHDFCKPVWESTHKTLGELVQACLEEKVM